MSQKSNYLPEEEKYDSLDWLIEFLCKHDDWVITFGIVSSIMALFQAVCFLGVI